MQSKGKFANHVVSFTCDLNEKVVEANSVFRCVFGIDPALATTTIFNIFNNEYTDEMSQYHQTVVRTRRPSFVRHYVTIASITGHYLFKRTSLIEDEKVIGVLTQIFLDDSMLSRKDLENDAYKDVLNLLESDYDFLVVTDRNGYFQYMSLSTSELLGYSLSEMIGHKRVSFMYDEDATSMMSRFEPLYENRLPFYGLQNIVRTKEGKRYTFLSNGTPLFTDIGEFLGYQVINYNITPLMDNNLSNETDSNSLEYIISSVKGSFKRLNSTLERMTDLQNIVSTIARSFLKEKIDNLFVRIDESLALIGRATKVDRVYIFSFNDDQSRLSNTFEWCSEGIEPAIDMLQNLDSSVFEWSMKTLREEKMLNIFDVNAMTDEQASEREILKMQKILSILIMPLSFEGKLIGFLGFDSVKTQKQWTDEIDMIAVLTEIYALVLVRMKNEKMIIESMRKNEIILNQTIEAFASIVEINDPYTSGHQNRTAELSTAIARKLGLDIVAEKTLYFASLLHDLGKFYVPSQILNKPGKLTEIEFSLIKTHTSLGYQVLKKIDFPWPIADIVHQHHERINGSGYPYGLIGNEILLEARILAVADVVESMSSHRPYRSALGIHAALNEIRKNKGVLYDSRVVQACLDLFENDNFSF